MDIKLLVVDDEQGILNAMKRLLRDETVTLMTADNPKTALEIVGQETIDIVITDLKMPGIDGIELLKNISRIRPGTMKIMMTAYGDMDTVIDAVNHGNIYKFITKPWEEKRMLLTIREAAFHVQQKKEGQQLIDTILKEKSEWSNIVSSLENKIVSISHQGIKALVKVVQSKDYELYVHSSTIAWLCLQVGTKMGLKKAELKTLILGALFHDIGKIAIRDQILYKEGKLDDQERKQMNHHATVGAEIVKELNFMTEISDIIMQHHERLDGKGYPKGLYGDQIHSSAKILTVCDHFVALSEERPYKKAFSRRQVIEILHEEVGTFIDPEPLKYLEMVLEEMTSSTLEQLDIGWLEQ